MMKSFFYGLKLFFVIAGAVMGAGYLSGGELVCFFRNGDYFPLVISGAVFFTGFTFLPRDKNDRFYRAATLITDGVFTVAALSGIDAVFGLSGIGNGLPIASVISLAVFHLFLSDGITAIERLNLIVMPLSIAVVFTVAILGLRGGNAVQLTAFPLIDAFKSGINAVLYASINVFATSGTVGIASEKLSVKERTVGYAVFSVFFVVFSTLILKVSGDAEVPVAVAVKGGVLFVALITALTLGSFTSLACFLFPLKKETESFLDKRKVKTPVKKVITVLTYVILFAVSRIEFYRIVKYLYPVIGGFGLFFAFRETVRALKSKGIKRAVIDDNSNRKKTERRKICLKRRKSKSKNLRTKSTVII